jgi:hypothetical protein
MIRKRCDLLRLQLAGGVSRQASIHSAREQSRLPAATQASSASGRLMYA